MMDDKMLGPYRKGCGEKPVVPWVETKTFGVLKRTLFPLMRLGALIFGLGGFLIIVLSWPLTMILGLLFGFLFFGQPGKFVKWAGARAQYQWPYVVGLECMDFLLDNKKIMKFMGTKEE